MLLISWDMDVPSYVMTRHARFIELKLNTANDRIKRLEEAGDRMRLFCADPDDCFAWDKAKEAKL
jgi:hypothetical protein